MTSKSLISDSAVVFNRLIIGIYWSKLMNNNQLIDMKSSFDKTENAKESWLYKY